MTLNDLLNKLDDTQEMEIMHSGGESITCVCTKKQALNILYDMIVYYLNIEVKRIKVYENTILINLEDDYTVNEEDLP